jgi:hypothetical protein
VAGKAPCSSHGFRPSSQEAVIEAVQSGYVSPVTAQSAVLQYAVLHKTAHGPCRLLPAGQCASILGNEKNSWNPGMSYIKLILKTFKSERILLSTPQGTFLAYCKVSPIVLGTHKR